MNEELDVIVPPEDDKPTLVYTGGRMNGMSSRMQIGALIAMTAGIGMGLAMPSGAILSKQPARPQNRKGSPFVERTYFGLTDAQIRWNEQVDAQRTAKRKMK